MEGWAAEISARFASTYQERSPSGTGLRIFSLGTLQRTGKGALEKRIEIYDKTSARYLSVTGQVWADNPITRQQDALDWLHARHMARQKSASTAPSTPPAGPLAKDDQALLERASAAKNGAKFTALWAGDWQKLDYPSQSEADAALCSELAFWTAGDAGRMDALFRQSGLMRPKWDTRRGDATYGTQTIGHAVATCQHHYGEHIPPSTPAPDPETAHPSISGDERSTHLTRLGTALRQRGDSHLAILAALVQENINRCRPPLGDDTVKRIARHVVRERTVAHAAPPPPEEWPEPIFPSLVSPPDIPASLLPGWAGDMAGAVARWSQVPETLPVLTSLSVLATGAQGRFEVAPTGDADYREPLALWTVSVVACGSRKTSSFNALIGPIYEWEKRERVRMSGDIGRNQAAREVAEKALERLRAAAAKVKTAEETEAVQEAIRAEREAMPAIIVAPRLATGNATPESVETLLAEQEERITVLSDEPGTLNIMAGLYTNGRTNLDVFLQGHAGSPMRVDRAGRCAHLDHPAVSFGLVVQPDALEQAGENPRFRGSGLLARFLYGLPVNNVGHRDVRANNPIPPGIRETYKARLFELLDSMVRPIGKPVVLPFDMEAREEWYRFAEHIERLHGDGRKYAEITDWTGKLPGAVARIAGLLALASHGPEVRSVDLDSVRRAVQLGWLLLEHANAAFMRMGIKAEEKDAEAIVRWIVANQIEEFTHREAQKAMESRFRRQERLKDALRQLEQCHIVSREHVKPSGPKGGRPVRYRFVNRRVLSMFCRK